MNLSWVIFHNLLDKSHDHRQILGSREVQFSCVSRRGKLEILVRRYSVYHSLLFCSPNIWVTLSQVDYTYSHLNGDSPKVSSS